MACEQDKKIVRELAKKYAEAVNSEKQIRMIRRMRDTNDLKIGRPPVILDEIPWDQMNLNGELTLLCQDAEARAAEWFFRKALFYLKHFKADNLFEPFLRVKMEITTTGVGIEPHRSDVKQIDKTTHIVSAEYADVLEEESALERFHDPVFTLNPEKDTKRVDFLTDLLGDSIPVKLDGFRYFYHAPWDKITRYRGVEPIMIDMYDRPEYLHAIMRKMISAANAELDFAERHLNVCGEVANLHCTPGYVSNRKSEHGLKSTWYRGMAQSFGIVSPAMFEEFELDYIKSMAERFSYTYYGCCEPLDNKIEKIKKISNLRKLGCSPWANVEVCAEQIGGSYVLSRKPNPSHVAVKTDPDVIRREVEETVKICIKYGCPYDYVLKDISTVSGRPENLIVWAQTVSDTLDRYYGAIDG